MSDDESAVEKARCKLADNLIVSSGSFSGLWDAAGVLGDKGLLGGELWRGSGDKTLWKSGGSEGCGRGGGSTLIDNRTFVQVMVYRTR